MHSETGVDPVTGIVVGTRGAEVGASQRGARRRAVADRSSQAMWSSRGGSIDFVVPHNICQGARP